MCKILKSSFRYLVPFTYEIEDGGYDKFSCVLQKDGKWTKRNQSSSFVRQKCFTSLTLCATIPSCRETLEIMGMFQYGLRQLRIEGNIRSLTSGLGGLEQIEAGAVG